MTWSTLKALRIWRSLCLLSTVHVFTSAQPVSSAAVHPASGAIWLQSGLVNLRTAQQRCQDEPSMLRSDISQTQGIVLAAFVDSLSSTLHLHMHQRLETIMYRHPWIYRRASVYVIYLKEEPVHCWAQPGCEGATRPAGRGRNAGSCSGPALGLSSWHRAGAGGLQALYCLSVGPKAGAPSRQKQRVRRRAAGFLAYVAAPVLWPPSRQGAVMGRALSCYSGNTAYPPDFYWLVHSSVRWRSPVCRSKAGPGLSGCGSTWRACW